MPHACMNAYLLIFCCTTYAVLGVVQPCGENVATAGGTRYLCKIKHFCPDSFLGSTINILDFDIKSNCNLDVVVSYCIIYVTLSGLPQRMRLIPLGFVVRLAFYAKTDIYSELANGPKENY